MNRILGTVFSLFLFMSGPALAEDRAREAAHDDSFPGLGTVACRIAHADTNDAVEWRELSAAQFTANGCPDGGAPFIALGHLDQQIKSVRGEPPPLSLDHK